MVENGKTIKKKTKSWHGVLFSEIDHFFSNFKYFFYFHENMFEIIFLVVYLIEQLSLLYFFYFGKYDIQLVVGFFTLLVLFTISFEKILLKMRNKKLAEEKGEIQTSFYRTYISIKEEAYQANKDVSEAIRQYNNLLKEYKKMKRKK